jgi:hypothetical protein
MPAAYQPHDIETVDRGQGDVQSDHRPHMNGSIGRSDAIEQPQAQNARLQHRVDQTATQFSSAEKDAVS